MQSKLHLICLKLLIGFIHSMYYSIQSDSTNKVHIKRKTTLIDCSNFYPLNTCVTNDFLPSYGIHIGFLGVTSYTLIWRK